MGKEIKIHELAIKNGESSMSSEDLTTDSKRDKHLQDFSGEQKTIIKLIAKIFVNSVVNLSEK